MAVQNLTTARFVLQCLQEELEEFDRSIPVARNLHVGDVTDALAALLTNRKFLRLTMPAQPSARRRRMPGNRRSAVTKQRTRISQLA